ncbi:MAG: hypothetical protein IPM07_23740, partial [Anaerolineales bacterium]|nr:hypothetical protein [Anaerolineales bacterium]
VRFVLATSSQGICESGVSCQLGNMALDATSTTTVVGVVASDVATGTTLANLARRCRQPDTNPSKLTWPLPWEARRRPSPAQLPS